MESTVADFFSLIPPRFLHALEKNPQNLHGCIETTWENVQIAKYISVGVFFPNRHPVLPILSGSSYHVKRPQRTRLLPVKKNYTKTINYMHRKKNKETLRESLFEQWFREKNILVVGSRSPFSVCCSV